MPAAIPRDAVVHSIDTAGRAVLFAGLTVMISVLGLLLMSLSTTRGVAIGDRDRRLHDDARVGHAAARAARLRRPQHRQVRPSEPAAGATAPVTSRSGGRWSRVLQRRPWTAFLAGIAILLVLAAPVLSMRLGFGDAGNRPTTDTTRQAYDILSEGFGPGFNGPLLLVASNPGGALDDQSLTQLSETPELDPRRGVRVAADPQRGGRHRDHPGVPDERAPGRRDRRSREPSPRRRRPRRDRGHRHRRARRWHHRRIARLRRVHGESRCRSSSARCWCCRSCC